MHSAEDRKLVNDKKQNGLALRKAAEAMVDAHNNPDPHLDCDVCRGVAPLCGCCEGEDIKARDDALKNLEASLATPAGVAVTVDALRVREMAESRETRFWSLLSKCIEILSEPRVEFDAQGARRRVAVKRAIRTQNLDELEEAVRMGEEVGSG